MTNLFKSQHIKISKNVYIKNMQYKIEQIQIKKKNLKNHATKDLRNSYCR